MKTRHLTMITIGLCCLVAMTLGAKPPTPKATTIQDGVLLYSTGHYLAGQPLQIGFDPYGYNYQAHMSSGSYANVYLGGDGFPPYDGDTEAYLAALTLLKQAAVQATWYWPYRDVQVEMKWNDAWLSNKDGNGDGKLDRPTDSGGTYIGSGAWETNHQSGTNDDGSKWNYFVKIVAVPADATNVGGVWYTADGTEIGPDIWGQFATIQEVSNDTGTGDHGVLYKSPAGPGFGKFAP